jgi:proteic killer suppression protein
VQLTAALKKSLKKLPIHIVVKFQDWVESVEERGLQEIRKIPGYHDEPCIGSMKGFRSIRLSRGYRAYYRILSDKVEFISVERIDKHEY